MKASKLESDAKSGPGEPKVKQKSTKIDDKSIKIRSWPVLGAQNRFGDAPGLDRAVSRTA